MRTFLLSLSISKIQGIVFGKNSENDRLGTVSNEFGGIVSLCLSVLPRCLTIMILVSFQTDRYMQIV